MSQIVAKEKEEFVEKARFLAAAQERQVQMGSATLQDACAALLALEKRARQGEDANGTGLAALAIVRLCAGDSALPTTEEEDAFNGRFAAAAAAEKARNAGKSSAKKAAPEAADMLPTSSSSDSSSSSSAKERATVPLLEAPWVNTASRAKCDWDTLNEMVAVLCRRRGQLKTVVQAVVRAGMAIVTKNTNIFEGVLTPPSSAANTPASHAFSGEVVMTDSASGVVGVSQEFFVALSKDSERLKLLQTLREQTEGKIFVEVERARLTHLLADVKEAEGHIDEAAAVLQSVQVETFGQMDKREKTAFILDQMRLCLAKRDFIKTQILSRKIAMKVLNLPSMFDLKLRFFLLLSRYFAHDGNWLEIARGFLEMYHTLEPVHHVEDEVDEEELTPSERKARAEAKKAAQESKTAKQLLEEQIAIDARKDIKYLELAALFAALSPHDGEQRDLLVRINAEKRLQTAASCEAHRQTLSLLLGKEIVAWAGASGFEAKFWGANGPMRKSLQSLPFVNGNHADEAASEEKIGNALRDRINEHNVRTIAGYYDRISLDKLAKLLDVSRDIAEGVVADLVVKKTVWARIDRPGGVVNFREGKTLRPAVVLNDWSKNVSELLHLVDSSCHLIQRENMVHKLQ